MVLTHLRLCWASGSPKEPSTFLKYIKSWDRRWRISRCSSCFRRLEAAVLCEFEVAAASSLRICERPAASLNLSMSSWKLVNLSAFPGFFKAPKFGRMRPPGGYKQKNMLFNDMSVSWESWQLKASISKGNALFARKNMNEWICYWHTLCSILLTKLTNNQ